MKNVMQEDREGKAASRRTTHGAEEKQIPVTRTKQQRKITAVLHRQSKHKAKRKKIPLLEPKKPSLYEVHQSRVSSYEGVKAVGEGNKGANKHKRKKKRRNDSKCHYCSRFRAPPIELNENNHYRNREFGLL